MRGNSVVTLELTFVSICLWCWVMKLWDICVVGRLFWCLLFAFATILDCMVVMFGGLLCICVWWYSAYLFRRVWLFELLFYCLLLCLRVVSLLFAYYVFRLVVFVGGCLYLGVWITMFICCLCFVVCVVLIGWLY